MHMKSDENRVKLDEVLKSLFNVSKKVLLEMMNSLFHEDYDIDNTEVTFENNEFVTDDYDIIRGDLFLKISNDNKPHHYHIELQTKNDKTMVIRMFEYGFKKAKELARCEGNNNIDDEAVIYIPKQLVMFIEENKNIKDELKMKLVFPDGQTIDYRVPVVKCWEYDDKRIIDEKMYPLLPLQIFKLRHEMENIKRSGSALNKEKIQKAILNAKETAQIVANESKMLYDEEKIDGEDLHKILLAVSNLFEYLNNKYGGDEHLNEEVLKMTKTLYDPEVEKKADIRRALKDAENLLKLGVSEEIVSKGIGIPIEKVREIKKVLVH